MRKPGFFQPALIKTGRTREIGLDTDTNSTLTKTLFPSRFYDAHFVNEYGRLESIRANRYNTCFSIILINVDGPAGLDLLKKTVSIVLDSVRSCDVAGLLDERQILIILPETDYFGALMTERKLSKALNALPRSVIFSNATFPKDGKGFGELVATAAGRARDRKESIWEKRGYRTKLFWEILGDLSAKSCNGFESASFDAGAGQNLSEFFLDQINELIIKEITRTPQRRGIMYYAARNISTGLPVVKNLSSAGATATKVFLVGEGESGVWEIRNAMPLMLDDPRLRETFFTFFLSEDSAYALVCKENWGATISCFHTADPALVGGLISRFQNEYSLQEQLG